MNLRQAKAKESMAQDDNKFTDGIIAAYEYVIEQFQEDGLVEKQKYGQAIGSHLGKPIYESFKDQGVTYIFDRLAQCDSEGCPLDQVKHGELLLNPGLIYRQAS